MAVIRTRVGTKDNGMPLYDYRAEAPLEGDTTTHMILTGPVSGVVQTSDGTVYDVTPEVIQIAARHVTAVDFHIAKMQEASGALTVSVHGPDWTGSPATVQGDETGYTVVPGS